MRFLRVSLSIASANGIGSRPNRSMRFSPAKTNRATCAATGLLGLCLIAATAGCSAQRPETSCPTDLGAIRAADQTYAAAWLANDPDQAMATLSDDAVIVPSGVPAMNDAAAIRAFWWPPDSPATTVTDFDLVQQETFGEKNFAFVRGSFMLRFLYDGKTFSSTGDYISIMRCQPDGSWRMAPRQWSDHRPPSD